VPIINNLMVSVTIHFILFLIILKQQLFEDDLGNSKEENEVIS